MLTTKVGQLVLRILDVRICKSLNLYKYKKREHGYHHHHHYHLKRLQPKRLKTIGTILSRDNTERHHIIRLLCLSIQSVYIACVMFCCFSLHVNLDYLSFVSNLFLRVSFLFNRFHTCAFHLVKRRIIKSSHKPCLLTWFF